jgi:hypothetical protein
MNPMKKTFILNATDELTEYIVYHELASMEENPENRVTLERLSAQEKTHYEFWQSLLPDATAKKIRPRWYTVWGVPFLRIFFGVTFITKFLESHENGAAQKYESIFNAIPESHRPRFIRC